MKTIERLGITIGTVLLLTACGSSSSGSAAPEPEAAEPAAETEAPVQEEAPNEESPYYFRDFEVVTKDYTMKITDWKIIEPGQEGNSYGNSPVIAFWYDTTNTSGKEIDPMSAWIYIMTAVQDNDPNLVNKLEVASLPDDRFLDSQMAKIKAGGTVENAMAYTLTDTETPVELTAKADMFGSDLGTQVFEIK